MIFFSNFRPSLPFLFSCIRFIPYLLPYFLQNPFARPSTCLILSWYLSYCFHSYFCLRAPKTCHLQGNSEHNNPIDVLAYLNISHDFPSPLNMEQSNMKLWFVLYRWGSYVTKCKGNQFVTRSLSTEHHGRVVNTPASYSRVQTSARKPAILTEVFRGCT
jgi:hypothetical protein